MATGIVKFFNINKGFGFIKEDGTGTDFFVHVSQLGGNIVTGEDRVSFEASTNIKGPVANNVRKLP